MVLPPLLPAEQLRRLDGLPLDEFWWATSTPAPLAGMPYPSSFPFWEQLATAGFGLVVCLHQAETYNPAPLRRVAYILEDLYHGGPPHDAVREQELVEQAATATEDALLQGTGVVVHCAGGTGRSGTVLGRTLVKLGHEPDVVSGWLNQLHQHRGRIGWPESPWQAQALAGP